jgi:endonuclease YncB( thermonuclease family)
MGVASISPDEDWPVVDGQTVPLSGLDSIVGAERQRFKDWINSHGQYLDCELSDDGANYRCFTIQRIDVAHAILLNGGACVAASADKDYYKDYLDAQAQAQIAKRGQWRYRATTECRP